VESKLKRMHLKKIMKIKTKKKKNNENNVMKNKELIIEEMDSE
jgi:hypothetical protein